MKRMHMRISAWRIDYNYYDEKLKRKIKGSVLFRTKDEAMRWFNNSKHALGTAYPLYRKSELCDDCQARTDRRSSHLLRRGEGPVNKRKQSSKLD